MLRAFASGDLFGQVYGSEPVRVLWLHGWGRAGTDFASAAELLAHQGVGSVALDLPGFGASPLPRSNGGAIDYANFLETHLDEIIGFGPVVIVGHSFGGRVASVLAARHPERFSHVLFTGAPLLRLGGPARAKRGYRLVRRLHAWHVFSDARLEAAKQKYGSADYRAASGQLRDILVATLAENYEPFLRELKVPTTLVWGEHDHDVPLAVAQRAAELIPASSDLVVLSGVGHLTPREAPTELARIVGEVLA